MQLSDALQKLKNGEAKPAFIVQRVEEPYVVNRGKLVPDPDNPKKKRVEIVQETCDKPSWIVSFPIRGHSIRITNERDLAAQGFTGEAGLFIDNEDGEGFQSAEDLQAISQMMKQMQPEMMSTLHRMQKQIEDLTARLSEKEEKSK